MDFIPSFNEREERGPEAGVGRLQLFGALGSVGFGLQPEEDVGSTGLVEPVQQLARASPGDPSIQRLFRLSVFAVSADRLTFRRVLSHAPKPLANTPYNLITELRELYEGLQEWNDPVQGLEILDDRDLERSKQGDHATEI